MTIAVDLGRKARKQTIIPFSSLNLLLCLFNLFSISPARPALTLWSFARSECNMVKPFLSFFSYLSHPFQLSQSPSLSVHPPPLPSPYIVSFSSNVYQITYFNNASRINVVNPTELRPSKLLEVLAGLSAIGLNHFSAFSRTPDRDFRCFYPCEIFLSRTPVPALGKDKK